MTRQALRQCLRDERRTLRRALQEANTATAIAQATLDDVLRRAIAELDPPKPSRPARGDTVPYTPNTWTDEQRALHEADDLDVALQRAACLAGGWYRRPVSIWCIVTPANTEHYRLMPSDLPAPDGYHGCYVVDRIR